MKTKIVLWVFVTIAFVVTLLGPGNMPWVPFGYEGQASADEVTVKEGIERIKAFDKALKSGDTQKIQQCAYLLRANHYALELIKNRPHLKLQLDKIPLKAPKVNIQGSIAQSPPLGQTYSSKAHTKHLQPKPGADALEASNAPKVKNQFTYQEYFEGSGTNTGSKATKKSPIQKSSGEVKASTGSQSSGSSRGSSTSADSKLLKKPIAHQSVKKIQHEAVSPKYVTASESAASSGKIPSKSHAQASASSVRPGTKVNQDMLKKPNEYKQGKRIQPESISPKSVEISKYVAEAKPKGLRMSTKTWNDLYQKIIVEPRERHYSSERKKMTESETTKLNEQMAKRNPPRKTYSPYAKGEKPRVDAKSSWTEINRAGTYNAETDLKKGAKFSKNPKLSTLVDPDSAYLHPDSVRGGKTLQDLRSGQAEALNNLKKEFSTRTKGMNPSSTQYKDQLKVYSQKKEAIEATFRSHDKRSAYFQKLQKNYPNIKATGSPPKNVRADVDIATETMEEAVKIKQEWQADGDDVLTYRDKKGRPYKIVNRTKDATMWPPETPAGRQAKVGDLDAFTTTGGQKATGNINQPSSHRGFNLDNQKKLNHALEANDWKTAAKSIDKAGRDVGLHKKNPEFYDKLDKFRNYEDGAQAGIYNTNDPPEIKQQKMRDFFKKQGATEMAKATKRAQELDVYKKKARTDLARQMRKSGQHDIADRITDRMKQVDVSNQQAEEFLKTGKSKTGHKALTKGKSSFAQEDSIVSKIKGNIAETRELNRLAKAARNLPDFDKGRIIQEARMKHGDEFAKKLKKKMTPGTSKLERPSAGQVILQGATTTAMVASKLSEEGSKRLREGKDYSYGEALTDAAVAGARTIPQVALAEGVGRTTYNVTSRKTRQFLMDWQEREQAVRVAKLKLTRARESGDQKKINKNQQKLEEAQRVLEKHRAEAPLNLQGYYDPNQVFLRILQGKPTFASDLVGEAGKIAKEGLYVPLQKAAKNNVDKYLAHAQKQGRARLTPSEAAQMLLEIPFDFISEMGPRQGAEGLYNLATGWALDRAELEAEKQRIETFKHSFTKHKSKLMRAERELEELVDQRDPNDPNTYERGKHLLAQYRYHFAKMKQVSDSAGSRFGDPELKLKKVDALLNKIHPPDSTKDIDERYKDLDAKLQDPEIKKLWNTLIKARQQAEKQLGEGKSPYGDEVGEELARFKRDTNKFLNPNQLLDHAGSTLLQRRKRTLDLADKTTSSGEDIRQEDDSEPSTDSDSDAEAEEESPFKDGKSKLVKSMMNKRESQRTIARGMQVNADRNAQDFSVTSQYGSASLEEVLDSTLEIVAAPTRCSNNSDCPSGYHCRNRNCVHSQCGQNSDCPKGYVCRDSMCIEIRPVETPDSCSKNSDCPEGYACRSGQCVKLRPDEDKVPKSCSKNSDCPEKYACRSGQCVKLRPDKEKVPKSCSKNSDCPEKYACRSGQCVKLRPDEDKVPKSCSKNSDCPEKYACRSGQCVKLRPDKDKPPKSCSKNSDCPEKYACRSGQCVKLRPDKIPDSCSKNSDCPENYKCRSGSCVPFRPKPKQPRSCSRDSDCPDNYICKVGKCVKKDKSKPCTPKNGCCKEKPVACMGYCWKKGTDCCGNAGICPPGQYCCGKNDCCYKGEICCKDGGCCPKGTTCCGVGKCCPK